MRYLVIALLLTFGCAEYGETGTSSSSSSGAGADSDAAVCPDVEECTDCVSCDVCQEQEDCVECGTCSDPEECDECPLPPECPDNRDRWVMLCHVPPGNPGNCHTIAVGVSAVSAHLAHGDYLGICVD